MLLAKRAVGTRVWRNVLATLMLLNDPVGGAPGPGGGMDARIRGGRRVRTFAPAFYHSAVNYTTLGYGLVVSPRWRLLGPLEATSGTLAFGWSTAVSSPWSSGWRGFVIAFSSDGKADHEG